MDQFLGFVADNGSVAVVIGGLIIGMIFGFTVYRTNFCAMGSISDILSFGDYRRFRAWLLAAATAAIGTQLLISFGAIDISRTMYLISPIDWLGNIIGGILFGFGMVFAGGCVSRNLVRLGGGDLRSLVTIIIIGIFAYMTIGGLLGLIRNELTTSTSLSLGALGLKTQGLGEIFGSILGVSLRSANLAVLGILGGVALFYVFKDANFRSTPRLVMSGIMIGLCVIAGWVLTVLAYDEFAQRPVPTISLTFVRPSGDTLEWMQRFTAQMVPGFGVVTVLGTILGAFVAAKLSGQFQVTVFADKGDMVRNLFGAALMGTGGVLALGCTIGQAVTGVSALALGGFITFAAIVAGAILGIRYLEQLLLRGG